jgi:hypothetical protein
MLASRQSIDNNGGHDKLESENTYMSIRKSGLGILAIVLLLLVAACGNTSNTPPTPQSGTVGVSTAGTAPIVVVTQTPTTSGQPSTTSSPSTSSTPSPSTSPSPQFVTLADRALALGQVSKGAGADASTTAVSVSVTIKNTSTASIENLATFYQLISAEGDIFGTQSSVTTGFYGAIAPGHERSGTIVFQVPTGAVHGLRLLFRPEVARDTLLLPLDV